MQESIRSTFLPDLDCIFVRVDLSQVEDRVVKMATRQAPMVELANLRPEVYDAHTDNASAIFGVALASITKDQRHLGKITTHATQRGMHGRRLSEELLDDGYIFTPKQCQKMIDAYLNRDWEIRDFYFPYVRAVLMQDKQLVNSWGRVWDIGYAHFDDDLYRRAYSFWPQSEAADLLNQRGLRPIWNYIKLHGLRSRVNLQEHDEVIVSCPLHEAYGVAETLVVWLERPRVLFGNSLRVPACVTVGSSWAGGHEWKRLPGEEEFREVCEKVMEEVS